MGSDKESFMRQLSGRNGWNNSSCKKGGLEQKMEGGVSGGEREVAMVNNNNNNKKRVMVLIDHTTRSKHAMMWALTHVTNKGDLLTLLHVVPPYAAHPHLATSLGSLCKACKPEVEVEALVIQGPKLATVLSQVKKLEASVLVLSQSKPSPFCCLFRSSSEDFVEQCLIEAECLTLAVKKQSKGVGGYLISTRWQKNFWLLA